MEINKTKIIFALRLEDVQSGTAADEIVLGSIIINNTEQLTMLLNEIEMVQEIAEEYRDTANNHPELKLTITKRDFVARRGNHPRLHIKLEHGEMIPLPLALKLIALSRSEFQTNLNTIVTLILPKNKLYEAVFAYNYRANSSLYSLVKKQSRSLVKKLVKTEIEEGVEIE